MSKQVVWKYQISNMLVRHEMPKGAEFLSVQTQHGIPVLWARVDPEAPKVERQFHVLPTGGETYGFESFKYLGTFQTGDLVWHVFVEPEA